MIRKSGYSVEHEEYEDGVCAVGAPVFNEKGGLVAGVSITAPKSRFSPDERQQLISLVTTAASNISGELGYRPSLRRKRRTGGKSDAA